MKKLAKAKGLIIVHEYVDVVESAKTEFRPAFQNLIRDIKLAGRPWDTLLALDTSRLSRRRYVAHMFKHDAQKNGVRILYAKMPEVDPITNVILESVMEALDEYHSLISREKGLAGMAENVRQGFRAGGRAPKGYELEYIDTGAKRDGQAVTKSRLRPSTDAVWVGEYLRRRANGESRSIVRRKMRLSAPLTSLISIEWNALTYAGHTVWNVNAERVGGAYLGGKKRRPRNEWQITRDTHPALIDDKQANYLLDCLETSIVGQAVAKAKAAGSPYLLTPLLETPEGAPWKGERHQYYRLKRSGGKRGAMVPVDHLQDAVLDQVMSDVQSPEFIRELAKEARRIAKRQDPSQALRRQLAELDRKIQRAGELALMLEDPTAMLEKVEELQRKRLLVTEEIADLDQDAAARAALANITEDQVAAIVRESADPKAILKTVVGRITLDPDTMACQIHYQLPRWLSVASPRGFEPLLPP